MKQDLFSRARYGHRLNLVSFYVMVRSSVVEHVYTLGLGPCGKVVTYLDAEVSDGFLRITQHCAGEIKVFSYPAHLLQSKVTFQYD